MIPPKKQYSIAKGERQGENWSSIVMAYFSALRIRNIDGKIVAITLPDTICARP
jgi:hypothetical protein